MNINIERYLNDDEIKLIVKEEFRNKVQENLRRNGVTTWIANLGYQNVLEIINTEIPEYESLVKEKTKEAIEGLTSYSVFRKKGLIDDEDSLGQKYLEQAVENNKEIINQKIINIFNELAEEDIFYEIENIISEKIENIFSKKKEEK